MKLPLASMRLLVPMTAFNMDATHDASFYKNAAQGRLMKVELAAFFMKLADDINVGAPIRLKYISNLCRSEASCVCNLADGFLDGLLKFRLIERFNIAHHFVKREFRCLRYRQECFLNDRSEFLHVGLLRSSQI